MGFLTFLFKQRKELLARKHENMRENFEKPKKQNEKARMSSDTVSNSNKSPLSSLVCDATALEQCFKRHPFERKLHCKKEIEAFEAACAAKRVAYQQQYASAMPRLCQDLYHSKISFLLTSDFVCSLSCSVMFKCL